MMCLPEHGVGGDAMANVTYAGAREAGRAMLDELSATGGLVAREVPPSKALLDVRATVTGLVNDSHDLRTANARSATRSAASVGPTHGFRSDADAAQSI